jgi:cellulose synthase/poly-beta-1,6-N-acetylglucosamine synthase-like glycosyltransferase
MDYPSPVVSIVIPVKPGLKPQALKRIARLNWQSDRFELLIAEGNNPGKQRNQAVQQAQGEIIYFLDDDSLVVSDALQRLERHFKDPQVIAVGGPSLTPTSDTLVQRAIGAVLSSLLGAGGVRNRYQAVGTVRETTERELILCNLAIRREPFLAAGGLDERLYPNEENELLDRLVKAGSRLLHDPELSVERSQRESLAAFIRQMFRYGRGRAQQTRIAGITGLMPFVPLFFVLYLLTLPLATTPLWLLPLLVYALACCLCGLRAAVTKKNPLYLLLLPFLFPVLHISNGFGILAGFLFHWNRQSCYNQQPVTVRRLQPVADPITPGAIRWT